MRTPPYAHSDGHDTEHAAADSMRKHAGTVRGQVLLLLQAAGEAGLTDDEGAAQLATQLPHVNRLTFGRRRHELVIGGQACKTRQRRRSPSGRKAIVWQAVEGP